MGSGFSYDDYAFRVYDLVGYTRLVELKRRILQQRVTADDLRSFLAHQPPELFDPYTEQPATWNAEQRSLSFEGHGDRFLTDGRLVVGVTPR